MSTFQEEQAALAAQNEETSRKAANNAALRAILHAYPQISPNEANYQLIEEYTQGVVSLEAIDFAFQNNSPLVESLSLRSDAQARRDFIEVIVSRSGGDASSKAFLRKSLNARFAVGEQYKDTDLAKQPLHTTGTLQTKADEATRRAELSKLSRGELRTIIKEGTGPENQNYVFVDGSYHAILPPDVTRERLQKVGRSGGETTGWLRKLIKVHGASQINARLAGRS
jgi:hypothetical protein